MNLPTLRTAPRKPQVYSGPVAVNLTYTCINLTYTLVNHRFMQVKLWWYMSHVLSKKLPKSCQVGSLSQSCRAGRFAPPRYSRAGTQPGLLPGSWDRDGREVGCG